MTTKILDYFSQIVTVPRASGNEKFIREWLIDRAHQNNLSYRTDAIWNLVLYVPATPWYENKPIVILQAHMDMVCVKSPTSNHDFTKDPLHIYEEEDWLKAKDTTLWADNGIAIAMMLSIVERPHPNLELFFTVDEERWLTWALHFDTSLLSGKYLINLDTEDEWEICISSAWWARVDCLCTITFENTKYQTYEVAITWLQWWHSGVDIHLNRWNAIIALLEVIDSYGDGLQLIELSWWQADNAIPTECRAILAIQDQEKFERHIGDYTQNYKKTYDADSLSHSINPIDTTTSAINDYITFISTLLDIPVGVIKMNEQTPDLVETSINLWMIQISDSCLHLTYAPRSSDNEKLHLLIDTLRDKYSTINWEISTRSMYPGRYQNPDDRLVQLTKKHYEDVLKRPVKVVAYHAWLECWAIVGKLWNGVQSVSIWPTIKHPHSINEKVFKPSVDRVYQVLQNILLEI